jgi:hypothetical protein
VTAGDYFDRVKVERGTLWTFQKRSLILISRHDTLSTKKLPKNGAYGLITVKDTTSTLTVRLFETSLDKHYEELEMMKTCIHTTKHEGLVGCPNMGLQCMRPEAHSGPHMVQRVVRNREYVIFDGDETDVSFWYDYVAEGDEIRFRDEVDFKG